MKRYFIVIGFIWIALALTGVPLAIGDEKAAMENPSGSLELPAYPAKGQAMVYIIRPSDVGLFTELYVYLDKKLGENRIGYTKGRQYIYFPVSPGRHKIISENQNSKYKNIDVKEGEIIFLRQNMKIDVFSKSNQDNMDVLSLKEGSYFLKQTTMGTLDVHP